MCDMDYGEGLDMDMDCDVAQDFDADISSDFESLEIDEVSSDYEGSFESETSLGELEFFEEEDSFSLEMLEDAETEVVTLEIIEEAFQEAGNNTEMLSNLRDMIQSGRVLVECNESFDEEGEQKILTRKEISDISEETEEDMLLEIDETFDTSLESLCDCNALEQYSGELEIEQLDNEVGEVDINYNEIYEEIQQEALEQGFEEIQIDADAERLDSSLENFSAENWEKLSIEEQKGTIENLADYVSDTIGFQNPPNIEYYNNEKEGDYGGYDAAANTLHINEYMLYNSNEAADTIAHELWHAHQYECAMEPQTARDYQYQYNFENYIKPEFGQEAYESQLIEAEARAFAVQFKDRLEQMKGR